MTDRYREGDRFGGSGDDRFDELLRDAARDYNAPPATPRELVWGRIEAERRRAGAGRGLRDTATGGLIPLHPRRQRQWLRWGAGIAAAVALGFGLGRGTRGGAPQGGGPDHGLRAPTSAPIAAVVDSPTQTIVVGPAGDAPTSSAVPGADDSRRPAAARSAPPDRQFARRDTRTSRPSAASEQPELSDTRPAPRAPHPAYTLAAIQHLTQAEALLTSFRAETRSGKEMDAQLSVWAKDLLSSTRLMLDSPAGSDPRMRRLLEDLELVLAQIAQLGAQRAGDERNLIDEAVEGRNVLPRLRTTIPAGARPVGS